MTLHEIIASLLVGLLVVFTIMVMFSAGGCAYTYRDYYQTGCCVNQTVEKSEKAIVSPDTHGNRPYTHP